MTIEQLTKQVELIAKLRSEEEAASRAKKEITEQLEAAEAQMMEWLAASNLTTFSAPSGKIVVAYRTSVRTPKLPEDREAFFTYLKNRGLYDSMISVNSSSINSLYKEELEEAKARGEADFSIPGIREVSIVPQLRFTRA